MNHSRGFTLLEMIVAIGIFAVIATVSFASLNRFLDGQAGLELRLDKLKQLQLAFTIIEQDMQYMSDRPVRDGYGDQEPAIKIGSAQSNTNELIRFTTTQRNTGLPGMSWLKRVAYRFEDDQLYRVSWQIMDRDQDSFEIKRILLTGISDASLTLLDSSEEAVQFVTDGTDRLQLPDGIEWRILMDDGREYRRIFEVRHAR